jgi:hypothetical protein
MGDGREGGGFPAQPPAHLRAGSVRVPRGGAFGHKLLRRSHVHEVVMSLPPPQRIRDQYLSERVRMIVDAKVAPPLPGTRRLPTLVVLLPCSLRVSTCHGVQNSDRVAGYDPR